MSYSATAVPAARKRGWTHWSPDRCPLCGRGLSARFRGVTHQQRKGKDACAFVVEDDAPVVGGTRV